MEISILTIFVLVRYSASASINNYSLARTDDEVADPISTQPKEIAAAGRVADLGDLYDARTDNFLEISLYSKDINSGDKDLVHSTNVTYSEIDYVVTESISEKMNKLGVDASLSISILGGKVELSGSAKYLDENKKKYKSAKTSLVYTSKTMQEHLKIFSIKSKNAIDNYLLKNVDATHVVVGLEWGANAVLSVEETNTESLNNQEIVGKFHATIALGFLDIEAEANVTHKEYDIEKSSTFKLHLHADIIPNKIPQTIHEAILFIRDIPLLMKTENKGRGKIMKYILMPIDTVRKVLKCESKDKGTVMLLQKKMMDQIIDIFQEMTDSQLQLNDAYNDISKWSFMVPENEHEEITKKKNEFDLFFNQLRTDFSDQVVQYRRGNSSVPKLNALIAEYRNSRWTPASIEQLLKIYEPSLRKVRLMDLFESYQARFIDRKTDKYQILAMNYRQEIRIISLNLGIDIESFYVRKITTLLKLGMKKEPEPKPETESEDNANKPSRSETEEPKAIPYFIEDDPDRAIPYISVYLEGRVIDSYPLKKSEYVLLISQGGDVTVINATSFLTINSYKKKEFETLSFAVINDLVYCVDRAKGSIASTFVENFIKKPEDIQWQFAGSFPPEKVIKPSTSNPAVSNVQIQSNTAVNGSSFYFTLNNHDLYNYDTISKTVTLKANIKDKCIGNNTSAASSMIVFENILYINTVNEFCSYENDNNAPEKRTPPDNASKRSGLFVSKNRLCRVGSKEGVDSKSPNLAQCYNSEKSKWCNMNGEKETEISTNEFRSCPGIATTPSGTIIFSGSTDEFTSAEIFNDDTSTVWSYIPTPLSLIKGCYVAFPFCF